MQRINLSIIILLISTVSVFSQVKMDLSASYSIPSSSSFGDKFDNGFGGTAEFYYLFNNSGFSASLLLGINTFRGTEEYEKELKDSNPTLFEYDYEIHYNSFPVMLAANYTFFREDKFNLRVGLGSGVQFMELKKKLIGNLVSDTNKEHFNEFAIYPNIGISYEIYDNVDLALKSGYNQTFGEMEISYIDFRIGIQYNL